jgi:hypothetical protein
LKRVTFFTPEGELTEDVLVDLLGLVMEAVPESRALRALTHLKRLLVYDWAIREVLRASDNATVRARPAPRILELL